MARVGGRPRQIETEDIVRAGREIGLHELSLSAVASRLGVSSTALYRHVDGRWGLESIVGESILGDLDLVDDPAHNTSQLLLSFGMQLRSFILENPGLAAYVQTLFPRGQSGRHLLAVVAHSLAQRGYATDAAIVLSAAVASVAIGYAASEDIQRQRAEGRDQQEQTALAELREDPQLGEAAWGLPDIDSDEYVRLWLGAVVRAFVDAAPPGRSPEEIREALDAAGKGL